MALSSQSEASPLNEKFNLEDIISGLASDLVSVRSGRMSVEAARVNAELAKQVFNGIRLVVTAQKYIQDRARLVGPTGDA